MIKTKSSSKRKLFSRLTKRFSRPAIFRKRDRKAPLPSETFQSSSLNSKRQSRSSLRSVFFRNSSRSISFDRRTQRKSFHFEETPENSTPKCFQIALIKKIPSIHSENFRPVSSFDEQFPLEDVSFFGPINWSTPNETRTFRTSSPNFTSVTRDQTRFFNQISFSNIFDLNESK